MSIINQDLFNYNEFDTLLNKNLEYNNKLKNKCAICIQKKWRRYIKYKNLKKCEFNKNIKTINERFASWFPY